MADVTSDIAIGDNMGVNQPAIANMQRARMGSATVFAKSTENFTSPANMYAVARVTQDDFDIPTCTRATDANKEDLLGLCLFDEGGSTTVTINDVVIIVESGYVNINTGFSVGAYLWLHDSTVGAFQDTPIVGQDPVAKVLVTGASGLIIYDRAGIKRVDQGQIIVSIRIGGIAGSDNRFLMAAPFSNCRINQVYVISDTATAGSDGSNNYTFQIENLTQTEDLLSAAKTTNGAEIASDTVYDLTPNQNQIIAADDVIELQIIENGTATDLSSAETQVAVEFQAV